MSILGKQAGIITALTLVLVACGGSRIEPPEVKLNPSPKQRYEITLVVEDPPERIRAVTGTAQLNVENTDCMPLKDKIAGVKPDSSFGYPIEFKEENEKFIGHVYADKLLDENYYGLGTCIWSLTGVAVKIQFSKSEQIAVIYGDKIIKEGSQESLCRRDVSTSFACRIPIGDVSEEERKSRFPTVLKSRKILI